MDGGEDVSINMEKLADSLSGKLETLHPLSRECSIYRVPVRLRCLHPSHYTPQMVSIGPLHHGKEELKGMEEHKQRYLKYFLQRTKVRMARFLEFIKEREAKLRDCYAETIHNLQSDEFVTMVLVDAVFVIELFLRYYKPDLRTDDDRIFRKSRLLNEIQYDLLMMENQLPLFIFNDLFTLAKTATFETDVYEEINFTTITSYWFVDDYLPIEKNLLEFHFSKAEHFVDLLILCLRPSEPDAKFEMKDLHIPSVIELHYAGVKFKPGSRKKLLDIKFNQGVLEIPFITLYDHTECLYRNLLVFESMHSYTGYFNDYIAVLCCLVKGPQDAKLLSRNRIIGLRDSEFLPTVFSNNLDKDCMMNELDFHYSVAVANLQAYCKLPCHAWKAILNQHYWTYFNTPWATFSVTAAVILLLLTVTQTVCSLIGL